MCDENFNEMNMKNEMKMINENIIKTCDENSSDVISNVKVECSLKRYLAACGMGAMQQVKNIWICHYIAGIILSEVKV